MMASRTIETTEWQVTACPPLMHPLSPAARYVSIPALVGILGTLLIHSMAICTLGFGGQGVANRQETSASNSTETVKELDSLQAITILSLPATEVGMTWNAPSQSLILSKIKFDRSMVVDPPNIAELETLSLGDDARAANQNDARDAVAASDRARLIEIYGNQIQARIERVWRKPRTPVGDTEAQSSESPVMSFQCEAQIVQDARGYVQEILLPRCNGSAAWQRSLVLAIQQSSPLPAPPSESVFSRSVTLSFVAFAYRPGDADDDYQAANVALAR